jgi:hypothetical protein
MVLIAGLAAGPAAWPTVVPAAAADEGDETIYTRLEPLETVAGVASLSRDRSLLVTVPKRCDGADQYAFDCRETRRYSTLIGVRFVEERAFLDEELVERETIPRGEILLAANFTPEDERAFEEQLRDALEQRSAVAFAEPYAGIGPGRPPFSADAIGDNTTDRAWLCYASEDSSSTVIFEPQLDDREPDAPPKVVGGRSLQTNNPELTDALCTSLGEALREAGAETIRTLPTPLAVERIAVSLRAHDGLKRLARPDGLWSLPEGGTFTREPISDPSAPSSSGSTRYSDGRVEYRSRRAGEHLHMVLLPAALDDAKLLENAWAARLTVRRERQELGAEPSTTPLGDERMWLALMPLSPTAIGPDPTTSDQPVEISLDEEAVRKVVTEGLTHNAEIDASVIGNLLVNDLAPAGAPAWMMAICRDDGSATYGIASMRRHAELEDARTFCGTLDSLIP